MKAVLLQGFGGPEVLDYREDVASPVPGPSEVLIKVAAAGVNNTDIWTREGAYGRADDREAASGWRGAFAFPRIQGGDIAGSIIEVGSGVDAARIGERVLVDPTLYPGEGEDRTGMEVIGSERTAASPSTWPFRAATPTRFARR